MIGAGAGGELVVERGVGVVVAIGQVPDAE